MARFILIALIATLSGPLAHGQDRWIFAVGGGIRPQAIFTQAVAVAKARLTPEVLQAETGELRAVVIGYSSEQPAVYLESFTKQFKDEHVTEVDGLLQAPTTDAEIAHAVETIERAKIICFTGGSQVQGLRSLNIPAIRNAIIRRYLAGVPLITTSAGTALLTQLMLTGVQYLTAPGFGLLRGFLIDQHFIVRNREWRLVAAMWEDGLDRGLALDEEAALAIKNERSAKVVGDRKIVIYERGPKGIWRYTLIAGDGIDLKTWYPTINNAAGAACSLSFTNRLERAI